MYGIDPATMTAVMAAAVVLITAVREIIMLWIRAKYRWKNGAEKPPPEHKPK
jgi:hypothetical protein